MGAANEKTMRCEPRTRQLQIFSRTRWFEQWSSTGGILVTNNVVLYHCSTVIPTSLTSSTAIPESKSTTATASKSTASASSASSAVTPKSTAAPESYSTAVSEASTAEPSTTSSTEPLAAAQSAASASSSTTRRYRG